MSNREISFFLGSNSPNGFYSLYESYLRERGGALTYIIKAGPGCGKSTFMRRIAAALSDRGIEAEYIRCSGDPESLDAVRFPELRLSYVDGTSPHALEPCVFGAAEKYLDLGAFCDASALSGRKDEIEDAVAAYKGAYGRAYSLISASADAVSGMYGFLQTDEIKKRLKSRAHGIAARELCKSGGGCVRLRFLGALTCRGRTALYGTVRALAEKVFVLDGEYGFSPLFLEAMKSELDSVNADYILCPDEAHPEQLRHIIVPSCSLAFVTQTAALPYDGDNYRHLRLDALADGALTGDTKKRLRACARLSAALEDEAVSELARAKGLHDALERIYNPAVDFEGVCALADAHISRISANFSPLP